MNSDQIRTQFYSDNPEDRIAAARALGNNGTLKAVRLLNDLEANDPDPTVRRIAKNARIQIENRYERMARGKLDPPPRQDSAQEFADGLLDSYLSVINAERDDDGTLINNDSWQTAIVRLSLHSLIAVALPLLAMLVGFTVIAAAENRLLGVWYAIPTLVVGVWAGVFVITLVGLILTHIVASLLGGQATLPALINNLTPLYIVQTIANLAGIVIGSLPCVGTVYSIAVFVGFFAASSVLIGMTYDFGWEKGLITNLILLAIPVVLTICAAVAIFAIALSNSA